MEETKSWPNKYKVNLDVALFLTQLSGSSNGICDMTQNWNIESIMFTQTVYHAANTQAATGSQQCEFSYKIITIAGNIIRSKVSCRKVKLRTGDSVYLTWWTAQFYPEAWRTIVFFRGIAQCQISKDPWLRWWSLREEEIKFWKSFGIIFRKTAR